MLDLTIQPLGLDISAPEDEQLEAGAPPVVQFVIVAGTTLPFQGPDAQPIRVPSAQIRFALPKEAALKLAEMAVEQADRLPDQKESDLVIANSLQGVDKVAEQFQNFR